MADIFDFRRLPPGAINERREGKREPRREDLQTPPKRKYAHTNSPRRGQVPGSIGSRVVDREGRQMFWTSVMADPTMPLKERLKASELLGRSEGDFVDRLKIKDEGPAKILVVTAMPDPLPVPEEHKVPDAD